MSALIQLSDGTIWDAETQEHPMSIGNLSRNSFTYNCYHHPIGIYFQDIIKKKIINSIGVLHSKFKYDFSGDLKILRDSLNKSINAHIGNDAGGEYKKNYMYQMVNIFLHSVQHPDQVEKSLKNPAIRTVISVSHQWIKRVYGKNTAYVFGDPRLITISKQLKTSIPSIYKNSDLILKIVDICLFLMKEDIYYRPRWILVFQETRETVNLIENSSPLLVCLRDVCEVCKDFTFTDIELANLEKWG